MPETPLATNWIPVARLLRPQGRRGEMLAEPLTDREGVFVAGRTVRLDGAPAEHSAATEVTLQEAWRPQGRNAGRMVLKLSGTDSIAAAEALQGREISLAAHTLPPLEPGTFLVSDLLGCTLFSDDQAVGTVTDIQFPIAADGHTRLIDAPDLLLVTPQSPADADVSSAPEPFLVPFVQAWLQEVDLGGRRIRMSLPEGLLHRDDDQAAGAA